MGFVLIKLMAGLLSGVSDRQARQLHDPLEEAGCISSTQKYPSQGRVAVPFLGVLAIEKSRLALAIEQASRMARYQEHLQWP